VIAPAREAGRDIVCDRYIDSTIAYQGEAIGHFFLDSPEYPEMSALEIGIELGERLNSLVIGQCVPDLTVLVRIDPELAERRGQQRLADGADRFEGRGLDYQRQVAVAYDALAERHPERIVAVDGSGTPEEVHPQVLAAVRARL
jgi:dTMP kinase